MLKTESMDDDTGRTLGLTGIRLVNSVRIILPSHAMLFQSKQVSCLWKCWPAGSLPLWSDHQLCHAIKGEFLSVYKQVLTGKNWLEQLDQIHDLWGDPLQSEAFFPHSTALRCPVSFRKEYRATRTYKLAHSILKLYVKYQRGCFSCRQRRVSHSLSELVRRWATLWSSEPEFTAHLLAGINTDSVEVMFLGLL